MKLLTICLLPFFTLNQILCQINENARYIIVGGKPGKRSTQTFDSTDEPIGSIDDGLKDKYITNPLGFYSTHTSAPWMIFGKNIQYFDRTTNNWEQKETLDHSRKLGAISQISDKEKWWFAGGYSDEKKDLKSEIISINRWGQSPSDTTVTISEGPDLPWPTYGHCMITLPNDGKILVIGGYHGRLNENMGFSSDVWAYDWADVDKDPKNVTIQQLNSLKEARMKHSCAIMNSGGTNQVPFWPLVVVAGGFNGDSMDTVEVLNYMEGTNGLYNTWNNTILGKLPYPVHSAGLVSSVKCITLTLIGGFSTKSSGSSRTGLLKTMLNKSYEDPVWSISNNTLLMARSDFAIIPNYRPCMLTCNC